MSGPDYRRGFGWNLAFNVFTKIANPLIGIVVANRLGPAVMGTYWLVAAVLTFTDIFRDSAFMRVYLRETEIDEPLDRAYAGYSVAGHTIIALLVAAIAAPMANHFGHAELLGGLFLVSSAVFVNGFSALPYTRLVRAARFKEAGLAESAGSVISSLVALAWVLQGGGFWALASMAPIRSVIFLGLVFRRSPYRLRGGQGGLAKRVFGASSILSAINIMWVGFSFGDQFLVAQLFGVATGGTFGAGKMMVQAADVLAKPITQTTTVAFAERKTDPEAVTHTLFKSLTAFFVAVAPVYVAVGFFAHPLVLGILSAKYAPTVAVLPPLCLYFAAVYPGSFAGDAMVMAGKEKVPFWGWVATYVGLAIVLTSTWGKISLPTMAWILASALVFVNLSTMSFAVRRYRPSREQVANLGRAIAGLLSTALAAWAIVRLPLNDLSCLAVGVFVIPVLHVAATGLFFNHNPMSIFRSAGVRELWARL